MINKIKMMNEKKRTEKSSLEFDWKGERQRERNDDWCPRNTSVVYVCLFCVFKDRRTDNIIEFKYTRMLKDYSHVFFLTILLLWNHSRTFFFYQSISICALFVFVFLFFLYWSTKHVDFDYQFLSRCFLRMG